MNQVRVDIYTDGGCAGNPGIGGWGVYIVNRNETMNGGELHTTNNRMELTAVIEALKHTVNDSHVVIHTDSQYVKNGATAWIHNWVRNGWIGAGGAGIKNVDLWKTLYALINASNRTISFKWVRGHDGDHGNEMADRLATEAIGIVTATGKAFKKYNF